MRIIEVREIWKATDLVSKLNILPILKEDTQNFGSYVFEFPDTPEVRQVINNYIGNVELKSFIESYKYLRSLIYRKKSGG